MKRRRRRTQPSQTHEVDVWRPWTPGGSRRELISPRQIKRPPGARGFLPSISDVLRLQERIQGFEATAAAAWGGLEGRQSAF